MKWQKKEAPFPSSFQELKGLQPPTRAAGAEAREVVVSHSQGAARMQPLPGGLGAGGLSNTVCEPCDPVVWGVSAGLEGALTRSRGRAVFLQAFLSTAASPARDERGRAAGPKSQLVLGREKLLLSCFLTPPPPNLTLGRCTCCFPACGTALAATGLPCPPSQLRNGDYTAGSSRLCEIRL